MKKTGVFILMLSLCLGCDDLRRTDKESEAIRQAIKSREIKKVSDVDILNSAKKHGIALSHLLEVELAEILTRSWRENQWSSLALQDGLHLKSIDSVSRTSQTIVQFIPSGKNVSDAGLEGQLLEAYQYNADQDLPLDESVQMTDDRGYVLYAKPLTFEMVLGFNTAEEHDLARELKSHLEQVPQDSSTRTRLSRFQGMWSIKVSTKEIVADL